MSPYCVIIHSPLVTIQHQLNQPYTRRPPTLGITASVFMVFDQWVLVQPENTLAMVQPPITIGLFGLVHNAPGNTVT